MSGTSGVEGFQNWEIPWAQRLQSAGYVALIVDSFTSRHLTFAEHWKLGTAARGQDALDAGAFLEPPVLTVCLGEGAAQANLARGLRWCVREAHQLIHRENVEQMRPRRIRRR